MKRWVCAIAVLLLMLSLMGCTQETAQDPLVQTYKESAQKYITAGELDTAIAILEDGLAKTNQNSELAILLAQVKAQRSPEESTPEAETSPAESTYSGFIGYWESFYQFMSIQEKDGKLLLYMICYSEYYDEYQVVSSVDAATATKTKVVFPFDDDCHGGKGNVTLYLEGDVLNYVITDFVSAAKDGLDPYGIGFGSGGGSLQRVDKLPVPLEQFEDNKIEKDSEKESDDANTSEEEEDDVYVGDWADTFSERATMTVTKTAGKYSIRIEWADSASENTVWTMTAVEKHEDGDYWLESTDCKKALTVYSEDGLVSKEVEYENGKAMIYYMDETLNWIDYTEYAGDDCSFEKIP